LKKTKSKILAVLLCVAEMTAVILTGAVQSFAAETYTATDGNEIKEEDLIDGMIEYRELGSLVHRNNITIHLIRENVQRTKDDYSSLKTQIKWERLNTFNEKDEAEDDKDKESYITSMTNEKIYMSAIESLKKILDNMDKSGSLNDSWKTVEKQLTGAAQNLMISYQSLANEEGMLTQLQSLYEQLRTEMIAKARAGMATETDVANAENMLSSVNNSLNSVTDGKSTVKKNLCIILGLDENGSYEIGKIPELDQNNLNAINIDTDIKTATSNNSTILSTRHASAKGTAEVKNKALQENGQNRQLETKMKELYGQIEIAQLASNSASTGMKAAERSLSSAKIRYSTGLSGKSEYLQSEQGYLQKKTAFEASGLNLFQAYETYEWAVKGITELE